MLIKYPNTTAMGYAIIIQLLSLAIVVKIVKIIEFPAIAIDEISSNTIKIIKNRTLLNFMFFKINDEIANNTIEAANRVMLPNKLKLNNSQSSCSGINTCKT